MGGLIAAIVTLLCFVAILASVYRWPWFWRLGLMRWLSTLLGPVSARRLVGLLAVLVMFFQLRAAADSLFGSLLGQVIFWGASGLLLWTALRYRRRR